MREIKFRTWDGSQMLSSNDIAYAISLSGEVMRIDIYGSSETCLAYHRKPKDSIILMQYTGLKDKNGKEIYEDDIVIDIHDKNKLSYVVLFGEWQYEYSGSYYDIVNGWHCRLWRKNEGKRYEEGFLLNYLNRESLEVIGNIYENSDLLK